MDKWRLIVSGELSGPENMAIDESLLLHFIESPTLPAIRIYGWSPPTLSIGRFQDARQSLNLTACAQDNIPVVRRITGGGSIFHHGEITYSLVCSADSIGKTSSVKESYRILCNFLILFYKKLGLEAAYALDTLSETLGIKTPLCFAGKEEYDIVIQGKKIGGNAQKRFKNIIFQHGSIPIDSDISKVLPYLGQIPEGIADKTANLNNFHDSNNIQELSDILISAFSENLDIKAAQVELSMKEQVTAQDLLKNKYTNAVWNIEGKE